jgi:hypothetical protein
VATGRTADVPLRSGDIVFVPKTVLGKSAEIANQILPLLNAAQRTKTLFEIE